MRVCRDITALPAFTRSVITIGTFDGVHLGHQKLIAKINELAIDNGGESIIITFDPHPRLVINPQDDSIKMLNTTEEKIELLRQNQVNNVVVVPFSREFSEQVAEEYITQFLVKNFHPSHIVIGYDHKFGKDRKGDYALLERYQAVCGYQLYEISKETLADIAISSTKIREALNQGQVSKANELLGHSYSLTGVVVKGFQNGRKLGYPTANVLVNSKLKLVPRTGIYAVKVKHQQRVYKGMLSIGYNPTFEGKEQTIEVNILDFDQDIYGENITIEFIDFIRFEKKFDSLNDLIIAMDGDKKMTEILVTLSQK